jgi:multiple sugar transport system substrate-binding protein
VDTSPLTVKLYAYNALTDEEFTNFFVQPVKNKYPYITMELIKKAKGTMPEELVSSGNIPDIILAGLPDIPKFGELDLIEDSDGLIKKFNVDLNRYDPATLQALRVSNEKGQLQGLPYNMNFAALYYNKDIFDKFGVSYPRDGMTWKEATELARKVTRTEGGVNYVGLDTTGITRVGSGLGLPLVDPKTNKSLVESDGWKKVLTMLKDLYDTPGYVNGNNFKYGSNAFVKDKTLAMLGEYGNKMTGLMEDEFNKGNKMNWDMAAIPNFEGSTGTGRETVFPTLFASKASQHKDQAFQVISLVGSDEVQQTMNRAGRLTILKKTDAFKNTFGAELASMKGKNVAAIFSVTPAPSHVPTEYDNFAVSALNEAEQSVALKQKDVNTALRDAREKADKAIEAAK